MHKIGPKMRLTVMSTRPKVHRNTEHEAMGKQLTVEYIPLSHESLHIGQAFDSIEYGISHASHGKHMAFIGAALGVSPYWVKDRLLPFQTWALPRILASEYGRLNETVLLASKWTLNGPLAPEQALLGRARVVSIKRKMGICFADFESRVMNASGEIYMSCLDRVLLLKSCSREAVQRIIGSGAQYIEEMSNRGILHGWTLRSRWAWRVKEWKNNIHTQEYARSLGFEDSLVEGPGIIDVIFSLMLRDANGERFFLDWKHCGAAYEGANVVATSSTSLNEDSDIVVCESERSERGHRVILKLKTTRL